VALSLPSNPNALLRSKTVRWSVFSFERSAQLRGMYRERGYLELSDVTFIEVEALAATHAVNRVDLGSLRTTLIGQ